MRKFLLLSAFLLFPLLADASNTITVSGTIADAGSNVYSTYKIVFSNNGQEAVSTLNGATFTQSFSGNLNASGAFSGIVLADNNAVSPTGSTWSFTFCTASSYTCFTQQVVVSFYTGTCANTVSCSLTSAFTVPTVAPVPTNQAYVNLAGGTPEFPFTPNVIGLSVSAANTGQTKPLATFIGSSGNGMMFDNNGNLRSIGTGSLITSPSLNGILYSNAAGNVISTVAGSPSGGTQCLVSTNQGVPTFSSCAGSTSTAWSSFTNPSGNLSLNMGANTTLLTAGNNTTGIVFNITDTASNNGTAALFQVNSAASSTAPPACFYAQGVSNGVCISTAGVLAKAGTGSVTADVISIGSPAQCSAGQFATGITGAGAANGCATPASSGSGGTGTQGQYSYFSATNTISGANPPVVDVTVAAPGTAYSANTASLTFTQGTATVGVSDTSYNNTAFIGSLLCYTVPTPNFCAVILGVGSGSITLSSPYPAATAAGVTNVNYTNTADSCARINASILNNIGSEIQGSSLTGTNLSCLQNPFNAVPINAGGRLDLGSVIFKTGEAWLLPYSFEFNGLGRGGVSTASNPRNSVITVDTTNFKKQYSTGTTPVVSAGVTFTAGSENFVDTNATGTAAFSSAITSATCDTGSYGHIVLTTAINGIIAGQGLFISGYSGANATFWNGSQTMVGVSGTSVELLFPATCPGSPGAGSGIANTVRSDILQASYTGTSTGLLTSSASGSKVTIANSVNTDFLSTDPGSCFITVSGTKYVVTEYTDSTHENIGAESDPGWAGVAYTKTCYVQSAVLSVTNGTTLVLTHPVQSTNVGTVTYSITPPVVAWQNVVNGFASGNSPNYGSSIDGITIDCADLQNCTGLQATIPQELTSVTHTSVTRYTGYAFDVEQNAPNAGPWLWLTSGASGSSVPTTTCFEIAVGGFHGINGMSCGGSGINNRQFTAVRVNAAATTLQNIHVESFINAFDICPDDTAKVNGNLNGGCPGVTILNGSPGVHIYNRVRIKPPTNTTSTSISLQILGNWGTNAPANAFVDDYTMGANCLAGRTTVSTGRASTGIYTIGAIAGGGALNPRPRFTDAYATDTCVGSAISGGNFDVTNNLILNGAPSHLNQDATGRIAGSCAMSSGTTCTFSIGSAYNSAPLCFATQQSGSVTGGAGSCALSSTTVTVTATSSNSGTWGALLIGNPN